MYNRKRRRAQRLRSQIVAQSICVLVLMFVGISLSVAGQCTHTEQGTMDNPETEKSSEPITVTEIQKPSEDECEVQTEELEALWCFRTTPQERYELAKLAMAEAEGSDIVTKALIVFVVLNRVQSDQFPNTIHDVIFQNNGDTWQFSPLMPGGRWWTTEPDDECYEVVEILCDGGIEDTSDGALYFESCTEQDNWHSRNLELLFESGGIRFYK